MPAPHRTPRPTADAIERSGVVSAIARYSLPHLATPVLQIRVDLATPTGSPGRPELVASSRATCNSRVAKLARSEGAKGKTGPFGTVAKARTERATEKRLPIQGATTAFALAKSQRKVYPRSGLQSGEFSPARRQRRWVKTLSSVASGASGWSRRLRDSILSTWHLTLLAGPFSPLRWPPQRRCPAARAIPSEVLPVRWKRSGGVAVWDRDCFKSRGRWPSMNRIGCTSSI